MGEAAPPAWVVQTQQTLGTLVNKPKLTDNLLKKPPFRFLHDVVTATCKTTGYTQGLFPEEMLDSKAIKDKDAKIQYLSMLITCVGNSLGYAIDVNPKKIVAGHEPEKTNALLQALYEAATADPGAGQQAVQRTLAGEMPGGAPGAGESASQRPTSSSQKKRAEPMLEQPQQDEPAFPAAPQADPVEKPRRRSKQRPEDAAQPPPPQPAAAPARPASPAQAEANEFQPPTQQRPLERPQTARRAPPKVKTNTVDGRPTSGKQQEQEVRGDGPRVIGEGEDSDDDDNMIVEAPRPLQGSPGPDSRQHGGLVENLMAAQEAQASAPQPLQGATDGPEAPVGGGGIVIKRKIGNKKDGRANYGAEVATLREALQQLCQHANPLGKTMDYIQEDLDSMHKELEYWKAERRKRQAELDDLSKTSEDHLQPVVERQAKAKESVAEMLAKITAVKSQISSNDSQIKLLLQNVTNSG